MLVMFGAHLEKIWGPKRFFIFYVASAMGAFALYNGIGVYQIMELKSQLLSLGVNVQDIDNHALLKDGTILIYNDVDINQIAQNYQSKILTPMVGASGAIFGIDFSPDGDYLITGSEDKTGM